MRRAACGARPRAESDCAGGGDKGRQSERAFYRRLIGVAEPLTDDSVD
jgi:hypothetical protein